MPTYYTKNEDGTFTEVPEEAAQVPYDLDMGVPEARKSESDDWDTYLHLADNTVRKVKAEDHANRSRGTNAPGGHFVENGKEYQIIGEYPRESQVKE